MPQEVLNLDLFKDKKHENDTLFKAQTKKLTPSSREKINTRNSLEGSTLHHFCNSGGKRIVSYNASVVSLSAGLRIAILAEAINLLYLRITPKTQYQQKQKQTLFKDRERQKPSSIPLHMLL